MEEMAAGGFSYGLLATCFAPVSCRSSFLLGGQRAERREKGPGVPSEAQAQQPNMSSTGPVHEASSVSERRPRLKDEPLAWGPWGHLRSHPGTFLPWQTGNRSCPFLEAAGGARRNHSKTQEAEGGGVT